MKYFISIILALIVFNVQGQKQKKYSFGFEVSPNVNWALSNTKRVENNSAKMGIKYGIKGDKFFGKNYAVTAGVMISHSAIDVHYNDSIDIKTVDGEYQIKNADAEYNMQRFEMPLGLKFRSNEIGYFRVLIEGGFINSVRIKSNISADEPEIDKEELEEGVYLYSVAYYFEGGVTYSLGAQLALKGTVYFSSGITDLTSDNDGASDRITQNSVGLKVGLVF